MGRYDISGSEGEYQAGSNNQVLSNQLGIVNPVEMNIAETQLLDKLYTHVFDNFPAALTFQTLIFWHRAWLGNIYSWAGQFRSVDMSKPNIRFASPKQLERLAVSFEVQYLSRFNELPSINNDKLVAFLAEMHIELILIHPFREGNGRLARLLLDVMAVKAGAQPLDYSLWDKHKEFYFTSIQAGLAGDNQHMERLIKDVMDAQQ